MAVDGGRVGRIDGLGCLGSGRQLQTEGDGVDLGGEALRHGVGTVVIPVTRLPDELFTLRTRIAGEIMQKLMNYRLRLVIVGDISAHTGQSVALRDFVREANRGEQIWFVSDLDALRA